MFKSLTTSVAVFLCLTGTAIAEERVATISITGTAQVEAAPDMATVSLAVVSEALTAAEALTKNSADMEAVFAQLRGFDIADRDLQTSGLSLQPQYEQRREYRDEPARIIGFTARNQVTVRVRDLAILGGLLDAVVQNGANSFNGLRFGLSEAGPLEDDARRAAMADALRKAQLYTEAAGVQLGDILSISENSRVIQPEMMRMAAAADSVAVPIAGGEVGLNATVSIVIALEQ